MFDSTCFRIVSAEDDAADAKGGDHTGAHRAGLQSHGESAVDKVFGVARAGGGGECQEFGVGAWVLCGFGLVCGAGDDGA